MNRFMPNYLEVGHNSCLITWAYIRICSFFGVYIRSEGGGLYSGGWEGLYLKWNLIINFINFMFLDLKHQICMSSFANLKNQNEALYTASITILSSKQYQRHILYTRMMKDQIIIVRPPPLLRVFWKIVIIKGG